MAGRKSDFTLTKLDDLFTTQAQRDEEQLSKIRDIPLELNTVTLSIPVFFVISFTISALVISLNNYCYTYILIFWTQVQLNFMQNLLSKIT